MPLQTRLTLSLLAGGSPVYLHGCKKQINYVVTIMDRFRRPGAGQAGYQTLGMDCPESSLDAWHACANQAEGSALIVALNNLIGEVVSVTYKEFSGLKCIVTGVIITKFVATRGPIISGSTPATFRLEATITLDHTP